MCCVGGGACRAATGVRVAAAKDGLEPAAPHFFPWPFLKSLMCALTFVLLPENNSIGQIITLSEATVTHHLEFYFGCPGFPAIGNITMSNVFDANC